MSSLNDLFQEWQMYALCRWTVETMAQHGYDNPESKIDWYHTFTNTADPSQQILVDMHSQVWLHMVNGVPDVKGYLTDSRKQFYFQKTLKEYLEGVPRCQHK